MPSRPMPLVLEALTSKDKSRYPQVAYAGFVIGELGPANARRAISALVEALNSARGMYARCGESADTARSGEGYRERGR
jgi:hypothetical protein